MLYVLLISYANVSAQSHTHYWITVKDTTYKATIVEINKKENTITITQGWLKPNLDFPLSQVTQIVPVYYRPQGVLFIFESGMLNISDDSKANAGYFLTNIILGYQFHNHYVVGIGTRFEIYEDVYLMPIYLDARFFLYKNTQFNPYLYLDSGWALGIFKNNPIYWDKGGAFAASGLGFVGHISEKTALSFSFGFKLQQLCPPGVNSSCGLFSNNGYYLNYGEFKLGFSL